jgi:hypothetical protein
MREKVSSMIIICPDSPSPHCPEKYGRNCMVWLCLTYSDYTNLCVIFVCIAVMSVMLSHHSGPVVVSAASNSHIVHYLAAEKITFKVVPPKAYNACTCNQLHLGVKLLLCISLLCYMYMYITSSIGILSMILLRFHCRIRFLLVSTSLSPYSSVTSQS